MIALFTPSESGYCSAFQCSSAKSAALSHGTSSNGYHSLETERWRLNKPSCGVSELLDEGVVLGGVYYESSHVLSFT